MTTLDIIISLLLIILIFGASVYFKNIRLEFKLAVAAIVIMYSIVSFFLTRERSDLFITILGLSWLHNLLRSAKARKI